MLGMAERENKKGLNLMTVYTRSLLEQRLNEANLNLKKSQLAIGEAAGRESDWHDNAAFDYANMQHDLNSINLSNLAAKLQNVEIISPRKKTKDIGIGNTVIIKFQDRDMEETFTILGPDDGGINPGWISYLSPLGNSLIRKRVGEIIEYAVGKEVSQKVKIIKILQGEF